MVVIAENGIRFFTLTLTVTTLIQDILTST